jgi:predicted aldo/keto reductase-like oxidoreductase
MRDSENKMNRRSFLKTVGAAGLGSVLAGQKIFAEPNEPAPPAAKETTAPQVPRRMLGRTGVEVPVFSFGAMFNIMENQVHLRKTLQFGVDYWDTADCYAGGNSELGIGKFLKAHPEKRKGVFIVTKACAREPEKIEALLQQSLKRMETNYVDLYFLHGVKSASELTDDVRKWADGAKKRGLIRFFGFSVHKNMPECLNAAARTDWIDGIMTSYNFRLMQDKQLSDAIETCYQKGIGLVAMKTQGLKVDGGMNDADKKLVEHFTQQGFTLGQAKIKAVLTDKRIASACVGCPKLNYLTLGISAGLDKTQLTQSDMEVFRQYAAVSCNGYCAGCANICEEALIGVPYISDIMRYMMYYNSYGDEQSARELFATIPQQAKEKLRSLDYKAIEARCPQHLPIGRLITEAMTKLA